MNQNKLNHYFLNSEDPKVCEKLYDEAMSYIKNKDYEIRDSQKEALLNHLSEMVKRNINKEKMEVEDKTVFNEISQDSIDKAVELVTQLKNISEEEAYLLSIHFEVVKYN